jgi:hypothetical protein
VGLKILEMFECQSFKLGTSAKVFPKNGLKPTDSEAKNTRDKQFMSVRSIVQKFTLGVGGC